MSKFSERLNSLGFATYEAYLRSPHWSEFKRAYCDAGLSRVCAVCSAKPVQLHHHTYARLGCEFLSDVTPLCRNHHVQVHACLKTCSLKVSATTQAIRRIRAGERFDPSLVTAAKPARKRKKWFTKTKKEAKAALREDPTLGNLIHSCMRLAKKKGRESLRWAKKFARNCDKEALVRMESRLRGEGYR